MSEATNIMWQVTALASLVIGGSLGLLIRPRVQQMDRRRNERRAR